MYFFSLENSAHLLAYRHLSSAQNGEGGGYGKRVHLLHTI